MPEHRPQGDGRATLALIGAGNRGADTYAHHIRAQGLPATFTAVAEPDPLRREAFAEEHGILPERRFSDWRELLEEPQLADGLIIATPDRFHIDPALLALERGYRILLEKPIAPDWAGVRELARAARNSPGSITVAHVLRHSAFFSALKSLLLAGRIGTLMQVEHTENIGYWHFAHSFVRGNWRREDETSPMILAKACHDLDIIRWLVDSDCTRISSWGGLRHFRPENAPPGSTARCTDGCAVERDCPYSAIRIYLERFEGHRDWPTSVLTPDPTPGNVRRALEEGPYGRCVYRSDNDVADHQTVALEFAGGVTAALTVSAFTRDVTRDVNLFGSHGEIRGRMNTGEIAVTDFREGKTETVRVAESGDGHAEADAGLITDFVGRLHGGGAGPALTDLNVSIESHVMAFAAERARHAGSTVAVGDFWAEVVR
ncbi:MAG TPA: Gfo/Idh/MocA family oxidoreductase [Deinococcales bacterium]|nr:Gfo/Idh/MocA family oxidoreductase [Deinococcales bacterium]